MDRLLPTGIPSAESLCLINHGRGGRRQVVAAVHGSKNWLQNWRESIDNGET